MRSVNSHLMIENFHFIFNLIKLWKISQIHSFSPYLRQIRTNLISQIFWELKGTEPLRLVLGRLMLFCYFMHASGWWRPVYKSTNGEVQTNERASVCMTCECLSAFFHFFSSITEPISSIVETTKTNPKKPPHSNAQLDTELRYFFYGDGGDLEI